MGFEYHKKTKDFYKDDERAELYHGTSVKGGKLNRHHIITNRERAIVAEFLQRVPHQKVLDLPSGTGKLAPVFKNTGSSVTACDVSENMLKISRKVYKDIKYENAEFQICDAEKASEAIDDHFNVAVCLRLLHRVPAQVKETILEELASLADHAIVSFGVHSFYHQMRTALRRMLFGKGRMYVCLEPFTVLVQKLEKNFEIMDYKWVLPWISQEVIFLLRSRRK